MKQIGEFYGATEGDFVLFLFCFVLSERKGASVLFNINDVDHSIGYLSPVANLVLPFAIVKYDQEKDEIVRDKNGRCILCGPDEPGEFIAKIQKQLRGEIARRNKRV